MNATATNYAAAAREIADDVVRQIADSGTACYRHLTHSIAGDCYELFRRYYATTTTGVVVAVDLDTSPEHWTTSGHAVTVYHDADHAPDDGPSPAEIRAAVLDAIADQLPHTRRGRFYHDCPR